MLLLSGDCIVLQQVVQRVLSAATSATTAAAPELVLVPMDSRRFLEQGKPSLPYYTIHYCCIYYYCAVYAFILTPMLYVYL